MVLAIVLGGILFQLVSLALGFYGSLLSGECLCVGTFVVPPVGSVVGVDVEGSASMGDAKGLYDCGLN